MAEVPSEEELQSALGKLKSGKAGGESGILILCFTDLAGSFFF